MYEYELDVELRRGKKRRESAKIKFNKQHLDLRPSRRFWLEMFVRLGLCESMGEAKRLDEQNALNIIATGARKNE